MATKELQALHIAIDNYNKSNNNKVEFDILYDNGKKDGSYIIAGNIEYNNGTDRQGLFNKRKNENYFISNVDGLLEEYGTTLNCHEIIEYTQNEVTKNRFLLTGDKKLTIYLKESFEDINYQLNKWIDYNQYPLEPVKQDNKIKELYMNSNSTKVLSSCIDSLLIDNEYKMKQITIATFKSQLLTYKGAKQGIVYLDKGTKYIQYIDIDNIKVYFYPDKFNSQYYHFLAKRI